MCAERRRRPAEAEAWCTGRRPGPHRLLVLRKRYVGRRRPLLGRVVGRRSRITAYFGGLALGLSLLVAGFDAARIRLVGPL